MATGAVGSGFLEEVDWDKYSQYRPQYPVSLANIILDHHRTHSNAFRLAHDIGSGSGIFAQQLAEHFQHVHVSDPNANFVQQARQNLDNWCARNRGRARFTFSTTPAEKAEEVAASGSVDLVALMQCAHWTNQDAMVKSVARSLMSKGTLVVVQYNPAPTVIGDEGVAEAVKRLFVFWGSNVLEARGGKESAMGKVYLPQGNAGVESIHLPQDTFAQEATKRIEINVRGRGKRPHAIPGLENLVAPSRADPQNKRFEYTSENAEGRGWRYVVGADWFRGVIGTVEQECNLYLYEEYLQEVEKLVQETSANGAVVVEWTVALLLATRRGGPENGAMPLSTDRSTLMACQFEHVAWDSCTYDVHLRLQERHAVPKRSTRLSV